MTHLPYILASYGLFAIVALVLALGASSRLRVTRARLNQVDPRAAARDASAADGLK
jgi:hypothetical protein